MKGSLLQSRKVPSSSALCLEFTRHVVDKTMCALHSWHSFATRLTMVGLSEVSSLVFRTPSTVAWRQRAERVVISVAKESAVRSGMEHMKQ